jgi:hypothetical protein
MIIHVGGIGIPGIGMYQLPDVFRGLLPDPSSLEISSLIILFLLDS